MVYTSARPVPPRRHRVALPTPPAATAGPATGCPVTARRHLAAVADPDSVAAWNRLHETGYPEADYTYSDGHFYGALRDADDVLRSPTLDGLRNRLLARERNPDGPY